MFAILQGLGFDSPAHLQLSLNGGTLLHQVTRRFPEKASLPWSQIWCHNAGRNLAYKTMNPLELHLENGCTISFSIQLRGGGGDGGSTGAESRDAFLKMYKLPKADKVDATEERLAKWTCCQLSGEALNPPCVCDELGTLFNKDAVVKALIDKTIPRSLSHIMSLKHLISIQLSRKPSVKQRELVKDSSNYQRSRDGEIKFQCPLTGLEFNGCFQFSVHVPSGYVLSERAIKEAPQAVEELIGQKSNGEDWLPLNGSPELVKKLKDKMVSKRKLKSKKRMRNNDSLQVEKRKVESDLSGTEKKKKKAGAEEYAPKKASKKVYASIFSAPNSEETETFLCRSVGARGMNLT
eukprot:g5422.t1